MQQGEFGEVGQGGHRMLGQQRRADHRRDGFAEQAGDLQPRIAARAIADGQVDLARGEVHQLQSGVHPDLDLGMRRLEAAQPRHQPLGGERGRHRDGEAAPFLDGGQQAGRLGQPVEGFAQGGQGGLRRVGEQQALGGALEQRAAYVVFQVLDLLAHGARRHRQLVGGAAEVHVPRGRFEGAQGVQRGQPSAIHSFPKRPGRTSACAKVAPWGSISRRPPPYRPFRRWATGGADPAVRPVFVCSLGFRGPKPQ